MGGGVPVEGTNPAYGGGTLWEYVTALRAR